jgi:Na+-transporting NADH:ubiquinone oxidoreductase subunit F
MNEIIFGSLVFVAIVLALTLIVVFARSVLMPSHTVLISIGDQEPLLAKAGTRLLEALVDNGIKVPAACGGAGTCGQCRVTVAAGSSAALPTERAKLTREEIAKGLRLSCQLTLRNNLSLKLPTELLHAQSWECTVVSSKTVSPLIREIILELPKGEEIAFSPGAFVQVTSPAYELSFADFDIAPEHHNAWQNLGLGKLGAQSDIPVSRAYSIANTPEDGKRHIVLLIRLALPPPNMKSASPGIVSSFLFGLKLGDKVSVAGPFGDFRANDSDKEMIFIGGGVGMAPLRAIITEQIERLGTTRRMSFWYGARSGVDLFYQREFNRLQANHDNFHWTVALSDPSPVEQWDGPTGFIHDVVFDRYLKEHPAPEDCEYYLCGPPLMIKAVLTMLDNVGVDPSNIFNDDFGS